MVRTRISDTATSRRPGGHRILVFFGGGLPVHGSGRTATSRVSTIIVFRLDYFLINIQLSMITVSVLLLPSAINSVKIEFVNLNIFNLFLLVINIVSFLFLYIIYYKLSLY